MNEETDQERIAEIRGRLDDYPDPEYGPSRTDIEWLLAHVDYQQSENARLKAQIAKSSADMAHCSEWERLLTLDAYEARALKRAFEAIGGALRWKIKGSEQRAGSICDGDWGHQIYAKLLRLLDSFDSPGATE